MKYVGWSAVAILVALALYGGGMLAWYHLRYLNDVVTTGSSYGLTIGMSKEEALRVVRSSYGESIYILHPLGKGEYGPHHKLVFDDRDEAILFSRDRWEMFFSEDFLDSLKLQFENGRLVEIYRHRTIADWTL